MKEKYINRLKYGIDKYVRQEYNESDFQSVINSVIYEITEYELQEFRDSLHAIEAELEEINFMVDTKDKRGEYLKQITKIESLFI